MRPSFVPVFALAGLMAAARLAFEPSRFYDPGWLILVGNMVFVTGVGLVVAYVAARTYRATGRIQILLLGCGVLTFGFGGALAALARPLPDGANLNVTIYNSGALLGASCHFAAAFLLLAGFSPEVGPSRRRAWLLRGYGASVLVIAVLAAASLHGLVPAFFVQGVGPTVLRQGVLGGADVLFVFSFVIFAATYRRSREAFLYWYASALALTALSLTAFLLQHSVGSPVGWVGRVSQYVGGVYFLTSLVTAARTAGSRGTSFDAVFTGSLSGAEEKFRALAENVPDAICRFDPELRVIYVNLAGQRLYGKAAGVVGGRLEQVGVPESQSRAWNERIAQVFRTGERVEFEEYLPTGRGLRFYQSRCVPERAPDGRVTNVLVVSRDLTERRRAEEALAQAKAEAEESNRQKDQFLAVLSHELRNPLAPIRNSVYVLGRSAPGSEQARRALAIVDRQAAQLARLVDDLLDVTRMSRNKIQLQRRRVDLDELVQRTVDDQRSLFENAGVRLELDGAGAPVLVDADPHRIAQIVGNLLQNAAKFTPKGGATRVSVSVEPGEKRATLRVSDTGVGMAPEMLSRLFQPFTQADSSLDRSQGGLGLGLALVKGLVELHAGEVTAHSDGLGRGSEVLVRLPLAHAEDATSPKSARAAAIRRRVLLIEDDVDAAETLRDALELAGHEIVVAHDGPDGIARARQFRPDVVLCDIGLPGMDGYEVARAFRADAALAVTFLVALTGYTTPADLEKATAAGFERYVRKPPSLDELEALVAAAPGPGAA